MREKPYNPDEPARQRAYVKLSERIRTQDDIITFLLGEIRALQKRVQQLENRHAHPAAGNSSMARPLARLG